MNVGVSAERLAGECRVALMPETVQRLVAKGLAVRVESGAGRRAWFVDDDYLKAGANVDPPLTAS
jgi:NAD(P) transhydrogenase subunit alpha